MAIYVTGDIHLNHDSAKLNSTFFPEGKNLTKNDYVIICGDCGFTWDWSGETRWWTKWYNEKPWTTLCCPGNHENYDILYNNFGLIDFHGGQARQIADSVYYLNNGDIYNLQGKKFFVMGGATSHDKWCRKEHISWWKEEIPSVKMMEHGLDNLEKNNNRVDYILTHCAPTSIMTYMGSMNQTFLLIIQKRLIIMWIIKTGSTVTIMWIKMLPMFMGYIIVY